MVLIFAYFPVTIFYNCKTKSPGFPKQYFFILSTRTNQRFVEALFCCNATVCFFQLRLYCSLHSDFLIYTWVFLAQHIKFHGPSHNSKMR